MPMKTRLVEVDELPETNFCAMKRAGAKVNLLKSALPIANTTTLILQDERKCSPFLVGKPEPLFLSIFATIIYLRTMSVLRFDY